MEIAGGGFLLAIDDKPDDDDDDDDNDDNGVMVMDFVEHAQISFKGSVFLV